MVGAILEGYPKSKKQFLVSHSLWVLFYWQMKNIGPLSACYFFLLLMLPFWVFSFHLVYVFEIRRRLGLKQMRTIKWQCPTSDGGLAVKIQMLLLLESNAENSVKDNCFVKNQFYLLKLCLKKKEQKWYISLNIVYFSIKSILIQKYFNQIFRNAEALSQV